MPAEIAASVCPREKANGALRPEAPSIERLHRSGGPFPRRALDVAAHSARRLATPFGRTRTPCDATLARSPFDERRMQRFPDLAPRGSNRLATVGKGSRSSNARRLATPSVAAPPLARTARTAGDLDLTASPPRFEIRRRFAPGVSPPSASPPSPRSGFPRRSRFEQDVVVRFLPQLRSWAPSP